ncbi:MAG: DNA replication and repair protein RecF [bacterium]
MRVTSVRTNHFRNLAPIDLGDLGSANIFVGGNAQGKTNILEAIYAAMSGGSFRISQDKYLVQIGEVDAQVFVEMTTDRGQEKFVQLFWGENNGKAFGLTVKVNGVLSNRLELIRSFPAVIFSPEDIDLLRLSASHRRRFMNLAIGRSNPSYVQDLIDYNRIRMQRNQLLLLVKQGRASADELDVWDEKMSEVGAQLVRARFEFMGKLAEQTTKYYQLVAGENGRLEVHYFPSINEDQRGYLEALRRLRSLDIARAATTRGAHRDDISMAINGQDVRFAASRGEFRSAVLALKFAEAAYLREKGGEDPVYLLDDAFSELDEQRQQALADVLRGTQSFITTHDTATAKLFKEPRVFDVEKGGVKNYVAVA